MNIFTIDIGNTNSKFTSWNKSSKEIIESHTIKTSDLKSNIKKIKQISEGMYRIMSSVVKEATDLILKNINIDHQISIDDFNSKLSLDENIGKDILSAFYNEVDDNRKLIILGGTVWVSFLINNKNIEGYNLFLGINSEHKQISNVADGIPKTDLLKKENLFGNNNDDSISYGIINQKIAYIKYMNEELNSVYGKTEIILSSEEEELFSDYVPSYVSLKKGIVSLGLLKLAINKI